MDANPDPRDLPPPARPADAGQRRAGLVRARLHGARWVLVTAAAAIVAVSGASGGSWWVAAAAMAAIVTAAAIAPRRRIVRRAETSTLEQPRDALQGLSAAELAAAVPDPILIFDANGSTLYANAAATAAFGDLPVGTLVPIRFRSPEMRQLIAGVLENRRPGAIDHVERVPLERAFRVFAMPVGTESGLHLLLFRDQSETRRIDRMRADFIANASHELRTPLASIAGFIDTLRGPARNDEKAREQFLQIMQAQTARMARLIDDLLSLSRIEMKPYVRSDQHIDLASIIDGVIESLAHLARENGVEIGFTGPETPVMAPGNRDELIQVFENLLENACKYGSSGGRVDISMDRHANGPRPEVSVTIRDYGPGIADAHIPRVTERFYRVDVESSRAQKGTGLGLAIVKHILTRHDGRLTIRSALGEGAAFTVHLPAE